MTPSEARPPLTSSSTAGRSSGALSPLGVVAAESAPSAAGVTLEGWLYKRGRTVHSWRRRFFRLSGSRLEYWESDPRAAFGAIAAAQSAAGGGRGAADAMSSRAGSSRSVGGGTRASSFFGSFSRSRSGSSLPTAAVDAALAATSSSSLSPATHAGPAPRGSMDLSLPLPVSRLDGASSQRRFRFCIATSARELQLRAESEADEGAWVAAFDALAGARRVGPAFPVADHALPEG